MTSKEQTEAAGRIIAKSPLTAEEQRTLKFLSKRPRDYKVPGELRICGVCGEEFRDEVNGKGEVTKPALYQFSDHVAFHNPSPAQWVEAHKRIQEAKEKSKEDARKLL